MKTTGYSFDIFTNTLTITDAFAKKASQYNSPEYKILMKLRADNSGLQIVKAEKKHASHKAISFKEMETFISKCDNSEQRLDEFKNVQAFAKIQPSPYNTVKKWFLENYANYAEQPKFDENGFVIVKTKKQMEEEKKATEQQKSISEETANATLDEEATDVVEIAA